MIEIAALLISLGAGFYHSGFSFIAIGTTALIISAVVFMIIRSVRGMVFGIFLGTLFCIGSVFVWQRHLDVPSSFFGTRVVEGVVVSVDRRLENTNIVVRDTQYHMRIQVQIDATQKILPGDAILFMGTIEAPEDFVTEQGKLFGYREYMESRDIRGLTSRVVLQRITAGAFSVSRIATTVRFYIADIYARYIAFPVDGIVSGMVVGYQGGLPKYIQELFRNTGVLHVLVLSGYNITLLAGVLGIILRRMPVTARTISIGIAIGFLVLISGAGVASVRAGIMGAIALVASMTLRTYQPLRALVLAYLFFFVISPTTIFADPGFHLSVLATVYMIVLLPKVDAMFSFLPKTKYIDIREILILAITMPIFMIPYTMYFSGVVPLATIFANILLAIATPVLMIGGCALIVASLSAPLAGIIGAVIGYLGKGVVNILTVLSHLPQYNTPTMSGWSVVAIYAVLCWVLFQKEIMQYMLRFQNSFRLRANSSDVENR